MIIIVQYSIIVSNVSGDCGGNFSGPESGIITSPNYPTGKYYQTNNFNNILRKKSFTHGIFKLNILFSAIILGKYHGPGKGLASRACNWYIHSRNGYRISMNIEFFSVEGDPAGM